VIKIFSPLNIATPLDRATRATRLERTDARRPRASHVAVTREASDRAEGARAPEESLEDAILGALEGLLGALELESLGGDRFAVVGEPGRFDRVFGGQTVAQALLAASATVESKPPHSLHAYFVESGTPEQALELAVDRVRDGRSISTRQVTVRQGRRPLLTAMASFHANPTTPEIADHRPVAPAPDQVPLLQDWVRDLPPELRRHGESWVAQPPPLELRIGEAPTFMGGASAEGTRSHWMRLPRDVGDDPLLHTALLAYASDYFLLDMAFRSHPERVTPAGFTGTSLDHAIWFHRPTRFDRWHLHTQQTVAISGHRGLVRGAIHDQDGHLVASVMQEVLVRPAR
jgi:acyl-CoA thioesterase II